MVFLGVHTIIFGTRCPLVLYTIIFTEKLSCKMYNISFICNSVIRMYYEYCSLKQNNLRNIGNSVILVEHNVKNNAIKE